jgi:hypothetical protein
MPTEEIVTEVLGVVMWKAGLQPAEDGLPVVLTEEFHSLPCLARALKKSPSGFCGKRVGFHGGSGTPAGMANLPTILVTRIPGNLAEKPPLAAVAALPGMKPCP